MRLLLLLAFCACMAGCAVPPAVPYASNERIAEVAYRSPGPARLTVFTMVNNRSGRGGHSAIMINGSQRVIFDPAGSFVNDRVPEQEDVLFGVTPAVLAGYKSAHARSAYHVVSQSFQVTPQQAEIALKLAVGNGAVPQSYCANATSGILRQVPGFEDLDQTFFPTRLMDNLSRRPGVVEDRYYEDDEGTILDGIAKVLRL